MGTRNRSPPASDPRPSLSPAQHRGTEGVSPAPACCFPWPVTERSAPAGSVPPFMRVCVCAHACVAAPSPPLLPPQRCAGGLCSAQGSSAPSIKQLPHEGRRRPSEQRSSSDSDQNTRSHHRAGPLRQEAHGVARPAAREPMAKATPGSWHRGQGWRFAVRQSRPTLESSFGGSVASRWPQHASAMRRFDTKIDTPPQASTIPLCSLLR